MQSPPLELVLDVVHIGTRNLIRNAGDPDNDTISEITRGRVVWLEEHGLPGREILGAVLAVGAGAFWWHICARLYRR